MSPELLTLAGIAKSFVDDQGNILQALRGVGFSLAQGEILGLVGESGSGKSTLARVILGLIAKDQGEITFAGQVLDAPKQWAPHRRRIQMVFQDSLSALDPRLTLGKSVAEPLIIHGLAKDDLPKRVEELLIDVGLAPFLAVRYPHQVSGGERQRACIARALATGPDLVVADEPVSALDLSTQAQIVNLLAALSEKRGLACLYISHDLRLVRHICDRIVVMYAGRICEILPADSLAEAKHPYTRALVNATALDVRQQHLLKGEAPSPIDVPPGCAFHPRCPSASPLCAETVPEEIPRQDGKQSERQAGPGERGVLCCHHPLQ